MDRYLDCRRPKVAGERRREVTGFLERQAAHPEGASDAVLVVDELVTDAVHHSAGSVWVSPDWGAEHAVVTVNDRRVEEDRDDGRRRAAASR